MNPEPSPLPPKKPVTLPVILAFVPSALGLALLGGANALKDQMSPLCIAAAVISIVCCAVSSTMLIKHNTTGAIVSGILIALLNLAITAGLGCAALLTNIGGH
ncbi:MAG: hypothetical protein P4L99_22325 [Chthoniobacter sp.]|nr:hypothetical protein [Chthoniobacter sp.]